MYENKIEEVKDKVSGNVKEFAGKLTDDKALEFEGDLQKGRGKAREFAGNVTDEMNVAKNKVVGGAKEVAGKLTNDEILQLRGKLQKSNADNHMTNKIIVGLGVLAGLYLVKSIFSSNED